MNYLTHNDESIDVDVNGTCLQGYITAKYQDLVAAFGKPTPSDGYKSDAEWEIKFENGTVATVYNWKNGRNYKGNDGLDVEYITQWNIGGFDDTVVGLVERVLAKVTA